MKRNLWIAGTVAMVMAGISLMPVHVKAQDEDSSSPFSTGADVVSSYLWRGTKFGTGPAIQPYVELGLGNFTVGGWGSYCFTTNEAAEADLYLSYGFDFGLSVGLTDYYFPGTQYFDFSDSTGSHGLEVNVGYEIGGLSLGANYMINEAGGAGTMGGDMYFELGYSFDSFGFFVGGGNGWHTMEAMIPDPDNPGEVIADPDESDFNLCNIGISASSEIRFSETFSLPVSGALIWNPDTEQFHVVVGFSL